MYRRAPGERPSACPQTDSVGSGIAAGVDIGAGRPSASVKGKDDIERVLVAQVQAARS